MLLAWVSTSKIISTARSADGLWFFIYMPPQEDWVTEKAEIGNATTHGRGLFATELIKKGEEVIRWGGEFVAAQKAQEAKERGKLVMQFDDDLFSVEDRGESPAYLINHSCDSNLWMKDAFTLEARRDIKKGEELTVDYSLFTVDENYASRWECVCGSSDCRHHITGKDWQIANVQEKYHNHFIPMINRRIAKFKE